jgi:hypothetical protein
MASCSGSFLHAWYSWKDENITWSLISAITDDPMIKQVLFTSPGANVLTAEGGRKPQTDHHYALAIALFAALSGRQPNRVT